MATTPNEPDSIALRLRTSRRLAQDAQRLHNQMRGMHGETLQKIAHMMAVKNFSVDMKENVEVDGPSDSKWDADLYVKWTRQGTAPMDELEKKEVYSFIHTLKGLGYKLIKEQESAHDIEVWAKVR